MKLLSLISLSVSLSVVFSRPYYGHYDAQPPRYPPQHEPAYMPRDSLEILLPPANPPRNPPTFPNEHDKLYPGDNYRPPSKSYGDSSEEDKHHHHHHHHRHHKNNKSPPKNTALLRRPEGNDEETSEAILQVQSAAAQQVDNIETIQAPTEGSVAPDDNQSTTSVPVTNATVPNSEILRHTSDKSQDEQSAFARVPARFHGQALTKNSSTISPTFKPITEFTTPSTANGFETTVAVNTDDGVLLPNDPNASPESISPTTVVPTDNEIIKSTTVLSTEPTAEVPVETESTVKFEPTTTEEPTTPTEPVTDAPMIRILSTEEPSTAALTGFPTDVDNKQTPGVVVTEAPITTTVGITESESTEPSTAAPTDRPTVQPETTFAPTENTTEKILEESTTKAERAASTPAPTTAVPVVETQELRTTQAPAEEVPTATFPATETTKLPETQPSTAATTLNSESSQPTTDVPQEHETTTTVEVVTNSESQAIKSEATVPKTSEAPQTEATTAKSEVVPEASTSAAPQTQQKFAVTTTSNPSEDLENKIETAPTTVPPEPEVPQTTSKTSEATSVQPTELEKRQNGDDIPTVTEQLGDIGGEAASGRQAVNMNMDSEAGLETTQATKIATTEDISSLPEDQFIDEEPTEEWTEGPVGFVEGPDGPILPVEETETIVTK